MEIATADRPLHCSRLPALMICGWRGVMEWAQGRDDTSSKSADTGSAVHRAAHAFHLTGDSDLAVKAMGMSRDAYPSADLREAERLFRAYAKANGQVETTALELQLEAAWDPDPTDTTGTPIHVEGTLDQIRVHQGEELLCDYKTSRMLGFELIDHHAYQLAAYQVMASAHLGRDVRRCAIIRVRDYVGDPKPGPGMWICPWNLKTARHMVRMICLRVAELRRGDITAVPGNCKFCPGQGIANCVPLLLERLNATGPK